LAGPCTQYVLPLTFGSDVYVRVAADTQHGHGDFSDAIFVAQAAQENGRSLACSSLRGTQWDSCCGVLFADGGDDSADRKKCFIHASSATVTVDIGHLKLPAHTTSKVKAIFRGPATVRLERLLQSGESTDELQSAKTAITALYTFETQGQEGVRKVKLESLASGLYSFYVENGDGESVAKALTTMVGGELALQ
jgi:hypothetical protein